MQLEHKLVRQLRLWSKRPSVLHVEDHIYLNEDGQNRWIIIIHVESIL